MESRERPVPIHRIEYDVNWPPGHVTSYLIDCAEPVLIDAGMPGEDSERRLRETLSGHGYSLTEIEHLVITHPHIDHIGQTETIIEAADPTVYAPASIQGRFDRTLDDLESTVASNVKRAGFNDAESEFLVTKAVESLRRNRELLEPSAVDVWLEGGSTATIGTTSIDVIHTPGHQADHCCYAVELGGERLLIAGDMAIESFRPVVLHAGMDRGVEDGIGAFFTALDRLAAQSIDRVYPGHGPVHTQFSETIEQHRERLKQTLVATVKTVEAAESPISGADVAAERAGSRDTTYIAAEVLAALEYLHQEGELNAIDEEGVRRYSLPEAQ